MNRFTYTCKTIGCKNFMNEQSSYVAPDFTVNDRVAGQRGYKPRCESRSAEGRDAMGEIGQRTTPNGSIIVQ